MGRYDSVQQTKGLPTPTREQYDIRRQMFEWFAKAHGQEAFAAYPVDFLAGVNRQRERDGSGLLQLADIAALVPAARGGPQEPEEAR